MMFLFVSHPTMHIVIKKIKTFQTENYHYFFKKSRNRKELADEIIQKTRNW